MRNKTPDTNETNIAILKTSVLPNKTHIPLTGDILISQLFLKFTYPLPPKSHLFNE